MMSVKWSLQKPLKTITRNPAWCTEEDIFWFPLEIDGNVSFWWIFLVTCLLPKMAVPLWCFRIFPSFVTLYCFESDQTPWTLALRSHQWAPVAGLSGGGGPCFQIPGKAVDWGQFIGVWESPCLAPFLACSMSRGALGATWPWQNRSQGCTNLFIRGDNLLMGLLFYRQRDVCVTWCVLLCFPGLLVQRNRVTPNRSVLYDPRFRNEKETCYIQKSHSLGACSPNLPGGAHHYGP